MSFTVIIPARYESTRLPGKPLVDLAGLTMVQRVYERAAASDAARVVVATDDKRIFNTVAAFDGEVVMTQTDHESGTDRVQEVCAQLQLPDDAIVVNVQGDEPFLPVSIINQVAASLDSDCGAGIATLCTRISAAEELFDPNAVKVVRDVDSRALYFSRAPLPWHRDEFSHGKVLPANTSYYRHLGIYAYRVETLNAYRHWSRSEAEIAESLEQLRAMENGVVIRCEEALAAVPPGIDTEADLQQARDYLAREG